MEKIRWRRDRLPTPVFWPGKFHGLYRPWDRKESDTTEPLSPPELPQKPAESESSSQNLPSLICSLFCFSGLDGACPNKLLTLRPLVQALILAEPSLSWSFQQQDQKDTESGFDLLLLPSLQPVGVSVVAQMVKYLPATQKTQVRSLGREDSLEKEMATHSSILAWRIPWTEEPGRSQSTVLQRVVHD